jgi:hypothetical protein
MIAKDYEKRCAKKDAWSLPLNGSDSSTSDDAKSPRSLMNSPALGADYKDNASTNADAISIATFSQKWAM